MKKEDLLNRQKFVYVGWPECQELAEIEGFGAHSFKDWGDIGFYVEADWIEENINY